MSESMIQRTVSFTDLFKKNICKVSIELPGVRSTQPPKFVVYQGRLFHYTGSGGGGRGIHWVNFYHEVEAYFVPEIGD